MAVITRIGLMVIMAAAVVVKAANADNFEYTIQAAESLSYEVHDNRESRKLHSELKHPNRGAKFTRVADSDGLHFSVEGNDSGLRPALSVLLPNSVNPELFYLTEMQFTLESESCTSLSFTVRFHTKKSKKSVEIHMDLFKPAKTEEDDAHARNNDVPFIESPLPSVLISHRDTDPDTQKFRGEVSWIDPILKRAVIVGKYVLVRSNIVTYAFAAGPVIIRSESFDTILGMDESFRACDALIALHDQDQPSQGSC